MCTSGDRRERRRRGERSSIRCEAAPARFAPCLHSGRCPDRVLRRRKEKRRPRFARGEIPNRVSAYRVADMPADSPAYPASRRWIHQRRRRGGVSKANACRRRSLERIRSDERHSRRTLRANAFWPGNRRRFPQSTGFLSAKYDGRSSGRPPRDTNDPHSEPDPRRPTA